MDSDKLLNIISLLEDGIESEDWSLVEEALKEINYVYDEFVVGYSDSGEFGDEYYD